MSDLYKNLPDRCEEVHPEYGVQCGLQKGHEGRHLSPEFTADDSDVVKLVWDSNEEENSGIDPDNKPDDPGYTIDRGGF